MIPWAHPSPQPKRHHNRFSRFLHSSPQSVPIFYNEPPLPFPQNCLFPRAMWTPSNTWFLELTQILNLNLNHISIVQPFLHTSPQSVPIHFTMGRPSPPSKLPLTNWFIWSSRVLNRNGISISAAVFAGPATVKYRPTDPQTTLLGR